MIRSHHIFHDLDRATTLVAGRTAHEEEGQEHKSKDEEPEDCQAKSYNAASDASLPTHEDGRGKEEGSHEEEANEQDEDGRYYIQELIKKAQAGGGWVDFKLKNSFQSIYVERVELGLENFIIGSGVYPISKQETVLLLAKSGAGFLRTHDDGESFREFIKKDGRFLRGDLGIFVVDTSGICYAWEDTHDLIWKNMMGEKDDTKKPYIKTFINTVRFGSGKVSYNINGRPRIAYVEKIEKGEKTYVIGSAYYK